VSNTNVATAGLYRTDVDNSQRVHDFQRLRFDNWFGFVTGNFAGTTTSRKLSAGYATTFGGEEGNGIFLGTWFNGNILSRTGGETQTLVVTDDLWLQDQTQTVTTTSYAAGWANSTNQLDLLIGLPGSNPMAFRVGFFQSWTADTRPSARNLVVTDNKDGTVRYQDEVIDYINHAGHLRPMIGWGMTLNMEEGRSLTPFVNASLDIYRSQNFGSYQSYWRVNNAVTGDHMTEFATGHVENYIAPVISLGTGFAFNNRFSVRLQYDLNFRLYDSDYDVGGFSGNSSGRVSWTGGSGNTYINNQDARWGQEWSDNRAVLNFSDMTFWSHSFIPQIRFATTPAENFRIGLQVRVPTAITLVEGSTYIETRQIVRDNRNDIYVRNAVTETITRTNGSTTDATTLTINPDIAIGASFQLVPERFAINAGLMLFPFSYSNVATRTAPYGNVGSITTTKVWDSNNVLVEDNVTVNTSLAADSVQTSSTWGQFNGNVRAGFVFDFSPQASLDLVATASFFTIDVTTLNVLFTVKF
jgi:hypothetical protein